MHRGQRKRTRGFRNPPNSFSVCRPSEFANPFRIGKRVDLYWIDKLDTADIKKYFVDKNSISDNKEAVRLFEKYQLYRLSVYALMRISDCDYLLCYCKMEDACHADSLIKRILELKENGELK